ncbi:MAG: hypothetical protein QF752_02490 [Planctomycetota bacterium]|nr:hypothetical protein [Planctomycetota bacterium]
MTEVLFYPVKGMGHVWPDGKNFLPERLVGKPSDRLLATDVIWRFFQKRSRR